MVNGGTPPYTHSWSNGGTTATITALSDGTYVDTVRDANGCVSIQSVVVPCSGDCDIAVAIPGITHVLCYGDNSGSATVAASSVNYPALTYTYLWNTTPAPDNGYGH